MSTEHLLCFRLKGLLLHTSLFKIKDCLQIPGLWIPFFGNYLLSDYRLPGAVLGVEDSLGKKMGMIPAFIELTV